MLVEPPFSYMWAPAAFSGSSDLPGLAELAQVPTSLSTCAQALRVNGLEQLCNNLASERLQLFCSQKLLAQEEVRGVRHRHGQGRGPSTRPGLAFTRAFLVNRETS